MTMRQWMAGRLGGFRDSVFEEMNALAEQYGVNLGSGTPDLETPAAVQAAAVLTGATALDVALSWAPACGVVAEPMTGDADYAEERRVRYGAAVDIEQPNESSLSQASNH